MRDEARDQHGAPDDADDDADEQFPDTAIEEPAREQVGRVAEHDAAGTDDGDSGGRHQPRPEAAQDDHDQRHGRQAPGAGE